VSSLHDWAQPGTFAVSPGVFRIPLPLPSDSLRAVNIYVIVTEDGLCLVDGGWAIPETMEPLVAGLKQLDATIGDIRQVLVTHVHRDHYTHAITLRRVVGTHVVLGIGEKPVLDYLHDPDIPPLVRSAERLRTLGAGKLSERISSEAKRRAHDTSIWEPPDEWLKAGSVHLSGGRSLEAIETPGHTPGHVVFHDLAGSLLFAGDHVLPTITPSIGFAAAPSPSPLADFLRSLSAVRQRPDALLLPAHGPVASSVHARVDELLTHHARRLDATEKALLLGADTPYEVARALTWTRHGRSLHELDDFNAMLAVFETAAHLAVLAAQGRATFNEGSGVRRYSTT
jgi:glyoxylase-like metal-dependent hydrolase (beta-lactamase superfamily II)